MTLGPGEATGGGRLFVSGQDEATVAGEQVAPGQHSLLVTPADAPLETRNVYLPPELNPASRAILDGPGYPAPMRD